MHLLRDAFPRSSRGTKLNRELPLIIGVGNPYRRDDGVGLVVIDQLRGRADIEADIVEDTGESASLIERWTSRRLTVLVDAVLTGAAAGTVHRVECDAGEWVRLPDAPVGSSHALGVAEAVELGKVLGRLPERLIVLGIEAGDITQGVGLSEPVETAVSTVVDSIVAEIASANVARAIINR